MRLKTAQKVYTISEAARTLNVSKDTIRRWDKDGKLKSFRTPTGHRRFAGQDIAEVLGTAYEPLGYYQQPSQPILFESKIRIPPQVAIRVIQDKKDSFPLHFRLITFLILGSLLSGTALETDRVALWLKNTTPETAVVLPKGAVLAVETQGGSTVTLASLLDSNFNLSVSGYIEAATLKSTATSGAPLTVQSTEKVVNFNADLLDGLDWNSNLTFAGTPSFQSDVKMTGSAKQFLFSSSSSDPTALGAGSIYYNTSSSVLKFYNGSTWSSISSSVSGDQYLRSDIADTADGRITFAAGALIHTGSPGSVSAPDTGDELVIEGSSNTGMTFLVPDAYASRIYLGSASDNDYTQLQSYYVGGYAQLYTQGTLKLDTATGKEIVVNDNSSDVNFRVEGNNNANLIFADAGNDRVGIGTSSPGAMLQIEGSLLVNGTNIGTTTDSDLITLGNGIMTLAGDLTMSNSGASLLVDGTNTSPAIAMLSSLQATAGNSVSGLYFRGRTDNPTPESAVYATILGGIDVPTSGSFAGNIQFQVGYSGGSAEVARFSLYNGVTFNDGGWDTDFRVESNDNANIFVVDAGLNKVGIGDAPSDGTLHIQQGSVGTVDALTTANAIVIEGSSATGLSILAPSAQGATIALGSELDNDYFTIINDPSGGLTQLSSVGKISLQSGATDGVIINEAGADRDFRVESDGNANLLFVDGGANNVGIGTATPTSLLSVEGAVTGKALVALNETGDQDILTASAGGEAKFTITHTGNIDTSNQTVAWTLKSNQADALNIGSDAISIDTSFNNVGINTAAPNYALDVNGTLNVQSGYEYRFGGTAVISGDGTGNNNYIFSALASVQFRDLVGTTVLAELTNEGNFGIGVTSADSKLQVSGANIGKALAVFNETGDQDVLAASASSTTVFAVDHSGSVFLGSVPAEAGVSSVGVCYESVGKGGATLYQLVDCNGTPSDLAEWYPIGREDSLEPGEVVAIGNPIGAGSTQAFLVKKSDSAYDSKLIGVVSTKAFQVMGEEVLNWAEKAVQVALVGRVPVKISSSSSPIAPGDFLTSSPEPGKAIKAENDGYTIGKALESWSPDSPTDSILVYLNQSANIGKTLAQQDPGTTASASSALESSLSDLEARLTLLESKTTLASSSGSDSFDNLSLSNLTVLGDSVLSDTLINGKLTMGLITLDSGDNSIGAAGALKIQPAALAGVEFVGGTVTIEPGGNLNVNAGVIKANDKLRGSITLESGQNLVRVDKEWNQKPSSIIVTPSYNTAIWVTDKTETGFTINVDKIPSSNESVDWLAIW